MKKIYTLAFALFLSLNIWAQTPQKMSYQAVIRSTSNALITSSPVGMKISILQGSSSGSIVYSETQTTNTNANGLVSIEIGNGTVVTGTFTAINWANGPYFIKTETDPTGGTAYTISGTSELLSVPYALHAKTAEAITGGITETDPVFVASPASGITTTSITNWDNKLDSEVDGSVTNEIQTLRISNDTVYLSNGGFAKLPSGFDGNYNSLTNKPTAVSSFSNDAGYLTSFTEIDGSVTNELQTLSINNDTIYLSNGGFAKLPVGFDGNYNTLTNQPTAVSSFSNDAGYLTSFTEVDGSITNELQTLKISNDTIYLSNGGFAKLPSTNAWGLNGNTGTIDGTNFIGTTDNVPLSFRMNNQPSGKIDFNLQNTALGYHSFTTATPDAHNSAFGAYSLENSNGAYNTAIGTYAYKNHNIGNYNTIIGAQAGENNINGSRNVFIGYAAGYNETGSNKLYIANDYPNPPLIYGDFATAKIGLGTITPTFKLEVTEDASFNGVRVGRGNGNISNNTSVGFSTLNSNTSGANNTAVGFKALELNTSGGQNTAMGDNALANNTSATGNTSIGYATLARNTTGNFNSALGYDALLYNTTGEHNTALGASAMHFNTIGKWNTAIGFSALQKNISGNNNTSIGQEAGFNNTSGNGNVFVGYRAGYNEMGSNKLYIANSSTTTPLIYGDFATGSLGIGTTNPTAKLQVETYGFSNKTIWGMNSMLIQNQTPSSRTLLALAPNGTQNADFVIFHNSDYTTNFESLYFGYENTSNHFNIGTSKGGTGTQRRLVLDATGASTNLWKQLVLATNGNVGVGTLTPGAKLEITGNVKIVDGTQAAGKILTSDATGLATWQAKESKAYGMIYRINAFDIPFINTWTDLPLDGGQNDLVNVAHSTTITPERITVSVSGTYLIQYVIHYRRQNFPHHGVSRIIKNGSNEILGSYTIASPISGDNNEEDPLSTQVITTLTANDYINLQVATNYDVVNEVDSYVGPDLPAPTTKVSVSITIVKIGD